MKGLFIPEITAEMFKNGCLESIETLMAEGEIYDIDYPLEQEPCEDAVSRDDILNELNRLGRNAFKDDTDYDSLFTFVETLSTVQPKEKECIPSWPNQRAAADNEIEKVIWRREKK